MLHLKFQFFHNNAKQVYGKINFLAIDTTSTVYKSRKTQRVFVSSLNGFTKFTNDSGKNDLKQGIEREKINKNN